MSLFDSPRIQTRFVRNSVDHRCLLPIVRLAVSSSSSDIPIAHKLLYRRTVEDPEVLVRFGLERRRLIDTLNEVIERGDVVPHLTW